MAKAHIIFGLGFGDEGKGTMTDFLCRRNNASLVVRYSGGSQAAHNVVTDAGTHHTFSQFGSGAFVPGVKTLVSQFMLWDPVSLAYEAAALAPKLGTNPLATHFIHEEAPVITPFHAAVNQLKEWMRGKARHGSCGKGVGETAYDLVFHAAEVLRAREIDDVPGATQKLREIQMRKQEELRELGLTSETEVPAALRTAHDLLFNAIHPAEIAEVYRALAESYQIVSLSQASHMIRNSTSVFEGAQGILIDEWHGFHPYTTWSTVTPANALTLLDEADFSGDIEVTGVLRAYGTRHGAGPFITESADLRGICPGEHNSLNDWQGAFRFGGFDGVMLRYAGACLKGVEFTSIALTHLDALERRVIPFWDAYRVEGEVSDRHARTRVTPEGVILHDLLPNFAHDLDHQAALTDILSRSRSSSGGTFKEPNDVIQFVEAHAAVPVRYLSFGPATRDKQEVFEHVGRQRIAG